MELILDIGSGKSLNNVSRAVDMMYRVGEMDVGKHKIVFKAQLFQEAPPNVPLAHEHFDCLYRYAERLGYPMTASVFDKESLAFLLRYRIPFVKIACRPDLYWLIAEVPRKIPVYVSYDSKGNHDLVHNEWEHISDVEYFACVRKYPASVSDYSNLIRETDGNYDYERCISDHTAGWELLRTYRPEAFEKHLCPQREADNPDSGPFSVTVEDLREVIA